jgi:uncharacterized glyoxalase superfamily protein PhnB
LADQMSVAMPELIPCLTVTDPQQTLEWFGKLGFQTLYAMPMPDGTIVHAHVYRGNAHFMLGPEGCGSLPGPGGVGFYLNAQEAIDGLHARYEQAGVEISQAPQDQFWGDRTFEVTHPDGYKLVFSQHVRDVSMEEMQEAMKQWAAAAVPA